MEKWLACELVLTMVVSIGACSGVNSGGQEAPPLTQEVGEPYQSDYKEYIDYRWYCKSSYA